MVTVVGILGGALLGLRYKVFSLVPVIMLGIATVVTLDRINGASLGSTALTAVILTVALQIGYIASIVLRSALFATPDTSMIKARHRGDRFARIF
jgi:hypothetical protein